MREGRDGNHKKRGRRVGAWLSIGLFLLQTFVTAVHFHPERLVLPAHPGDGFEATSADFSVIDSPDAPLRPSAHNDCALCAAIHLAGSAIAPPAVTLGASVQPDVARPVIEPRLASAPYSLFRSRAPPFA
ncbi:MAG TPA: hypothetical protein VET85_10750 [Stellaceae bacterium]|nr:hypothetical protein [Stellaceae bacterium]